MDLGCQCVLSNSYGVRPARYTERMIKARKEHKCCECGEPILHGERYQSVKGLWGGEWVRFRTCAFYVKLCVEVYCGRRIFTELRKTIIDMYGLDYVTNEIVEEDE